MPATHFVLNFPNHTYTHQRLLAYTATEHQARAPDCLYATDLVVAVVATMLMSCMCTLGFLYLLWQWQQRITTQRQKEQFIINKTFQATPSSCQIVTPTDHMHLDAERMQKT